MLPGGCLAWPPPTTTSLPGLSLDLLVSCGAGQASAVVPCNQSALSAASGWFSAQLALLPDSAPRPHTLDLPSVPPDIFRALLLCCYTGRLEVTTDTAYPLFWSAQLLQMPAAIIQCSQFISSKLQPSEPPASVACSSAAPPLVVKPIARPGVPFLSLTSTFGPSFLRPHLASFYSDWFLRYSALTRGGAGSARAGSSTPPPGPARPIGASPHPDREGEAEGETVERGLLLDTAACDGPVKFQRVVNKFFTVDVNKGETDSTVEETSKSTNCKYDFKDIDSSLQQKKAVKEEDEEGGAGPDTGETYSCIYCNHVFKSHYCYQKHKRRHINPVTVDIQENDKKFLNIKDLNVQYFPCKICGAKFPSYYFVHKHKKMWHKAQLELEDLEKGVDGDEMENSESLEQKQRDESEIGHPKVTT